jgi:hypothetical protein
MDLRYKEAVAEFSQDIYAIRNVKKHFIINEIKNLKLPGLAAFKENNIWGWECAQLHPQLSILTPKKTPRK